MRLTLMSDYAMRTLLYLAVHPDRLCTIPEIARAHAISQAHLTKVVHGLGVRGWVQTVRGKHGGLRLAHRPEHIVIGQVVRDTEPDFAVVECLRADDDCRLSGHCGLTHLLQQAVADFLARLDQATLADLLPAPGAATSPVQWWAAPPAQRQTA